jgi:hypothetical protein
MAGLRADILFLDITLPVDGPTVRAVYEAFLFSRKNGVLLDAICISRSHIGYHYVATRLAPF